MVARADAPGRRASVTSALAMAIVVMILWTRWEVEVHEVCDGRLPLAIAVWTHGELSCQFYTRL